MFAGTELSESQVQDEFLYDDEYEDFDFSDEDDFEDDFEDEEDDEILDDFAESTDLYFDDVFKEEDDVDEPYDDVEAEDGYGSFGGYSSYDDEEF